MANNTIPHCFVRWFLVVLVVFAAGLFCIDAAVAEPLIYNKQDHVDTEASGGKVYRFGVLAGGNIVIHDKAFRNCKKPCKVDFVVTSGNMLVLGNKHTYMTGGMPVQAAGELTLKQAKGEKGLRVTRVSNGSGHYKPSRSECSTFGSQLRRRGIGLPMKGYLSCK